MMSAAQRRLNQGLRALIAFVRPPDLAEAREVLGPRLTPLFRQMRLSEQNHCLRVMHTLRAQGCNHPDLLVAALLHDVGKTRYPLTLFGRTLPVLVKAVAPRLARRLSQGEPCGLRRPFVVVERHPQWGAEMLAEAGASPLAVTLTRRHQEHLSHPPQSEEDRLLLLLQAADMVN
jgi:hypothetical protein